MLQERRAELEKLLSLRRGLSEQQLLLAVSTTENSAAQAPSVRFELRRRDALGSRLIEADAMSSVLPGDVLIVSLLPTEPAG